MGGTHENRFRSRLEARWARFFDACHVAWEYEPEGYDLGDGLYYLPDFLLHGVDGRDGGDLYVEVKGQMTELDALKINRFAEQGGKVLVVGKIPEGDNAADISEDISRRAYSNGNEGWPYEFNFETIDGDHCSSVGPSANSYRASSMAYSARFRQVAFTLQNYCHASFLSLCHDPS